MTASTSHRPLPQASRLRRGTLVAAALSLSLVFGVGLGTGSARAEDSTGFDQVLNSNDAKNDRSGAPSGSNLVALKTDAATAVAKRQRVLDRLSNELSDASVDCGANAELTTTIADSSVVLNEIAGRIAAATDMKVAKAAASELFPATRVFALVLPQVQVSLICASTVAQTLQLQARISAGTLALDPIRSTIEAQAALAQGTVAAGAALKSVPSLGPAATGTAQLVPDRGDPVVAAANAAALNAARTPVRAADAALVAAERSVREFERLAELAKKRAVKTTKVKKPVK